MELVFPLILIALLLVLIVATCALFTNAIEWVGHRFNFSEGAVGSVFAAVGTALPETLVPIIAILSGVFGLADVSLENAHDIGIGAILGAPFLLGTLAMCVTAISLYYFTFLRRREATLKINTDLFRRDFHYFFPAYLLVFSAALVPVHGVKVAMAIGLLVFYGIYVYRTIKKEHAPDEEFHLPPLIFAFRQKEPSTALILVQVFVSLALLLVLVHFFVDEINTMSHILGLNVMLLSLIITPIATELPEKFNSVLWIKNGRDNLALGNITGAMVFQSCIPTAVGLMFTPWVLNPQGILSVGLCFLSSVLIYVVAWRATRFLPVALLLAGGFYLLFVIVTLSAM